MIFFDFKITGIIKVQFKNTGRSSKRESIPRYGIKNLYAGVPVIIGSKGVEKIVELKLSQDEKENFKKSVDAVSKLFDAAKKIDPDLA